MRIIGGRFRGLALTPVGKGDAGAHLRPTADRVRESLFNVLAGHGVPSGPVLDIFAGTGALGLEALSRGATAATFVDSGRVAQRLIRANLAKARAEARVLTCDARRLPPGAPCDLVFLDPPYGKSLGGGALASARAQGWVAGDALVVWEETEPQAADGFDVIDERCYGDTWITLLRPR